jgi:hypothetical protein
MNATERYVRETCNIDFSSVDCPFKVSAGQQWILSTKLGEI